MCKKLKTLSTKLQLPFQNRFSLMILLFLIVNIDKSIGLKCYKCTVTNEIYKSKDEVVETRMCSKFDESDAYIVDCPYSTMCLKTISTLYLQNKQKQETITRGCAQQKYTTQVFRNREWQQEHSIEEVYKEECQEFNENNLAGSTKTHCYCRGDLCNAATKLRNTSFLENLTIPLALIMAVIYIFT